MLLLIGQVDEYIVKVIDGEVINIGPYTIVNIGLKRSRYICQSEGQNLLFKLTLAGLEYSLEFVSCCDLDEVVGSPKVLSTEGPGFTHSIE